MTMMVTLPVVSVHPATAKIKLVQMSVAMIMPDVGLLRLDGTPYRQRFLVAMDDDLDTPTALAALDELADAILAAAGKQDLVAAQGTLRELAGVMGLGLRTPHR